MRKIFLFIIICALAPSCSLWGSTAPKTTRPSQTVTESQASTETQTPTTTRSAARIIPPPLNTQIPTSTRSAASIIPPAVKTQSPTTTTPPPTPTTSLLDTLTDQLTGDFDYFILALAWEPEYCANNEDPQACAPDKKYGFILHGLWPTYVQGWPSYCSTEPMTAELMARYPDLYPNDFLYTHEWEKHGTCTGLDPEGYLLLSRELKESVRIPEVFVAPEEPFRMDADSLVQAFLEVNPGFGKHSFSLHCSQDGGYFGELYVCFSRAGVPIQCLSEVVSNDAQSCGMDDFLVREPK